MHISYRPRMILDILVREPLEITLHDIAKEVNVSSRTIHRELFSVEQVLAEYDLTLHKKSGVGIQIMGDSEKIKSLKKDLMDLSTVEYTAEERKILILTELLTASNPIKLISLAIDYKATISVISHDLDDLELWLKPYNVSLIRKRGYGVELTGSEISLRNAIIDHILTNINEFELLSMIKNDIQLDSWLLSNSITQQLFHLFDKDTIIRVEHALSDLEQNQAFPLTTSSYINLVIYIAITIGRIETGRMILPGEHHLNKRDDEEEYKIAQLIVQKLETEGIVIAFPSPELSLLVMQLKGSKLQHAPNQLNQYANVEMMARVRKLIKLCEQQLKVAFSQDQSLFEGLLMHIVPTLYRITNHKVIHNPLLTDIQKNYRHLYDVIEAAASEAFPAVSMPEDEIGYLVLHFGASMERNGWQRYIYRVLVVCLSGIGTSKMLASRINTEFSEIKIVGNLSWSEAELIPKTDYDLIISTTPLPLNQDEYLIVSPLLPPEAIAKTRLFLARTRSMQKSIDIAPSVQMEKERSMHKLRKMLLYLNPIITLLDGFQLYEMDKTPFDFNELLHNMAETMVIQQIIGNANVLVQHLEKRSAYGGIAIPDSPIVFFHTRNEEIRKPSLSMFVLTSPMEEITLGDEKLHIQSIILMLAPEAIEKQSLEVLSEISVLLLDSSTIDILQTKDRQRITNYLAAHMEIFCENLFKKEKTK
jgi:mannitol operon transcriptional antiterminator